ncbi:hypothetical protein MMC12_008407 [Toensbergia leucococca]|nr:hypothetical protein [Toensbergia leucococca]
MKGVIEYDRLERERKERRERGEENGSDDDGFEAAEELNTAPIGALEGPSLATRETSGVPPQDESDEYEEVEVTDDEDDENPTKRQKTEIEDPEQPVEFNEDDIAYQLAAMGQDYGLDPGEYGDGEDEELEEGAGGLPLTEEDTSALFKDMLDDHHISPYTTWEKIIESNVIVEDDRYTVLPNMKSRKEIWGEWSMDRIQRLREKRERQEKQNPLIPFLAFLQNNATPKLYWPEFRRKFKKESEMRDAKLSDKEREKWYRDYINRLKLPERTLKADLVTLLKSTPLHTLNRSTPPDALPPVILIDLRYISLRSAIRDPMISTYITTLLAAPKTSDVSPEEEENISRRKNERERREDALAERERRVQEEKRRQRGQLQYSKGMLREGEEEVRRAMRVGKEGLKGYLERDELGKGS